MEELARRADATEYALMWLQHTFSIDRDEALRRLDLGSVEERGGEVSFTYLAALSPPVKRLFGRFEV